MSQDQETLQVIKRGADRLRQGIPFTFNDILFSVFIEERQLNVAAFTSWLNITAESAAGDINRAQSTYSHLKNEFPEFANAVAALQPRFSVIQDMGNMIVELASLSEDGVVALAGEDIPQKA
jgi:hypothetical protein